MKNLTSWTKSKNSLSSSTFQKLFDGFKVYNKYMNFNFIKSIYYLICLSINFIKKINVYFFFIYSILIIFFAFILKKKKFSNYTGDNHQLFSNKKIFL